MSQFRSLGGTMNGTFTLHAQSASIPCTTFTLEAGKFVLGRSSDCDFIVTDATISRRHAEITAKDGKVSVRDLDSSNGTYVNDQRVRKRSVRPGDRLCFGRVNFVFTDSRHDLDELDSDLETPRCNDVAKTLDGDPVDLLTYAQHRVFAYLLEGLPEKQIAERLYVSHHTVHNHVREIYRILNVHTRSEFLAKHLHRNGDE